MDWLIERQANPVHRLTSSLYEYCAGVLWGGFEDPLSRTSAFYQIVAAFVLLIVSSSYTANLAAFITISSQPGLSSETIDQIRMDNTRLCLADGGHTTRFDALYPRAAYLPFFSGTTAADALVDGSLCDGVVTTRLEYDLSLIHI